MTDGDLDPHDEWPSTPPEPTDRAQTAVTGQLPVRKCIYCDTVIGPLDTDDTSSYVTHVRSCPAGEDVVGVDTDNQFSIVVPGQTGYVWRHQTGGFACRRVAIQGTLIPIGRVREFYSREDSIKPDLDGKFDAFDDPDKARRLYLCGLRHSTAHEYESIDLGELLVEETLDGVYADKEEVREQKRESRPERIQQVWERIDEHLPFTYERVAAPFGRPVTQEGLRWINVTGQQHDDPVFQREWVDLLVEREREDPVALYYPNSD